MKVQNQAGLPVAELGAVESKLGSLESLADVLRWGRNQPQGLVRATVITDVVIQDEFTHDAIVPWGDAQALVFGST